MNSIRKFLSIINDIVETPAVVELYSPIQSAKLAHNYESLNDQTDCINTPVSAAKLIRNVANAMKNMYAGLHTYYARLDGCSDDSNRYV